MTRSAGPSDPMRQLLSVQRQMNQLFEAALGRTDFETGGEVDTWRPRCDVYESGSDLVLCLELPGFEMSQIDVRLDGDELVVEGERKMDREQPGERFHRVERSYGKFARRFRVPSTVRRDAVNATYRDGVLRVVLPTRATTSDAPVRVSIS
jgi:HSP20 family protein